MQDKKDDGKQEKQIKDQSAKYAKDCAFTAICWVDGLQMRGHLGKRTIQCPRIVQTRQLGMMKVGLGIGDDTPCRLDPPRQQPASAREALFQCSPAHTQPLLQKPFKTLNAFAECVIVHGPNPSPRAI